MMSRARAADQFARRSRHRTESSPPSGSSSRRGNIGLYWPRQGSAREGRRSKVIEANRNRAVETRRSRAHCGPAWNAFRGTSARGGVQTADTWWLSHDDQVKNLTSCARQASCCKRSLCLVNSGGYKRPWCYLSGSTRRSIHAPSPYRASSIFARGASAAFTHAQCEVELIEAEDIDTRAGRRKSIKPIEFRAVRFGPSCATARSFAHTGTKRARTQTGQSCSALRSCPPGRAGSSRVSRLLLRRYGLSDLLAQHAAPIYHCRRAAMVRCRSKSAQLADCVAAGIGVIASAVTPATTPPCVLRTSGHFVGPALIRVLISPIDSVMLI